MTSQAPTTRRAFLHSVSRASALSMLAFPDAATAGADEPKPAALPADPPRDLKPTAADLGSLFTDVQKLATHQRSAWSFLGDRFRKLEDFKEASRQKILELLLYRPEPVDPK